MSASPLGPEARAWLKRHALAAALAAVRGGKPSPVPADPPEEILGRRGVFVTVRVGSQLRGCMGTLRGEEGLIEATGRLAVAATVGDDRFSPVREQELVHMELELSVLGALQPITSPREITAGRHGVAVSHGTRLGVLLPHVAVARGWSGEQFVEAAAHKAGIARDAVAQTRLERFEAEVF